MLLVVGADRDLRKSRVFPSGRSEKNHTEGSQQETSAERGTRPQSDHSLNIHLPAGPVPDEDWGVAESPPDSWRVIYSF